MALIDMKIDELKALAKANDVELTSTKKVDIVAELEAAGVEAPEGDEGDDNATVNGEDSKASFVPADEAKLGDVRTFKAEPNFYAESPYASVVFGEDGFFRTSNAEQIKLLEKLEADKRGGVVDVTDSLKPKKATKEDKTVQNETIDTLREEALSYGINVTEDASIKDIKLAIEDFKKQNPVAAGDRAFVSAAGKKESAVHTE